MTLRKLLNLCYANLPVTKEDIKAARLFATSGGNSAVFIFQKGISADYYIAKLSNSVNTFEQLYVYNNDKETHHQSRIQSLRQILGDEICAQLIEQGLFATDAQEKRQTKEAIKLFLQNQDGKQNSSFQMHRLICLFEYPAINIKALDVHHLDLNGKNNKGSNLMPINPALHTSKNSLHKDAEGNYRTDLEVIKLGKKYKEEFLAVYGYLPCSQDSYRVLH